MNTNILVMFSPILIGIVASLCVLYLMMHGRKAMIKMSEIFLLIAFIGGLTLYTIGYMPRDAGLSDVLLATLRGLFSTGCMFLISDNYEYMLESPDAAWLTENNVLMIVFWLCHLLAFVVTISVMTTLFGRRAIDYMRMRRGYDACYIILGADWRAQALGRHIAQNETTRKTNPRRMVVFICDQLTDEFRAEVAEFGGITFEAGEDTLASQLRRAGLGARRRIGRIGSIKLVVMPEEETRAPGLLQQAIDYAEANNVAKNKLSLYLIADSDLVRERALNSKKPYSLYATSETELAVRKMIKALPPWKEMAFDDNHKPVKGLTALILGFNLTGEEALRRLVMNGQFSGVKMRAIAVDKYMQSKIGRIKYRYPALDNCCEIEYKDCDVTSDAFYELLDSVKSEVNYVVVAMGNDKLNLTAAQSLREYWEREEIPQPAMAIFMQSACPGFDDMDDKTVLLSRSEDLFTESLVIHEELDRMAMAVNAVHSNVGDSPKEISEAWHNLNEPFHMESSRAAADFIPAILHMAGFTEEAARSADDFHSIFSGKITPDSDLEKLLAETEHMRWNAFHYVSGYTQMDIEQLGKRIEYLRNNNGDINTCRQDFKTRRHFCLARWDELDDLSKSYNERVKDGGGRMRNFSQDDIDGIRKIPHFIKAHDNAEHE